MASDYTGFSALSELFGEDGYKPQWYSHTRKSLGPLGNLGREVVSGVSPALKDFNASWKAGTGRQEGLAKEQEGVTRTLLGRRMASDPMSLYKGVQDTWKNLINTSAVNPVADLYAKQWRANRMAQGFNPAAIQSTADRLGAGRQSARAYYDALMGIAPQINPGFNQVFNAGITDDQIAQGYIPSIMAMYRGIDSSGLVPMLAGLDAAKGAAGVVNAIDQSARPYGFLENKNAWDKLGYAGQNFTETVNDAVNTASKVYGMMSGMGGLGGMMGGMGGGGSVPSAPIGNRVPSATAPSFIPAPSQPAYGGEFYPGPSRGPVYPWSPATSSAYQPPIAYDPPAGMKY